MKTLIAHATALLAASWLHGQAEGKRITIPIGGSEGAKSFKDALKVVDGELSGGEPAWDFKTFTHMCELYMRTTNGGRCFATVECDDGKALYNADEKPWKNCVQGGDNELYDPRIGVFFIKFDGKDTEAGQGLTRPILRLQNVPNKEIDVEGSALVDRSYRNCKDGGNASTCKHIRVCRFAMDEYREGREREYSCGVPKLGTTWGKEIDSNVPNNERGYAPGICQVKAVQGKLGDGQFTLEAWLYDTNRAEIGWSNGRISVVQHDSNEMVCENAPCTWEIQTADGLQTFSCENEGPCTFFQGGERNEALMFDSKLPLPFIARWDPHGGANDVVEFEYDALVWHMNDWEIRHCSLAAWRQEGADQYRDITCLFPCK